MNANPSGGDLVLADIESMVFEKGVLYACDKATGKIARLADGNGDGGSSAEYVYPCRRSRGPGEMGLL